MTTTRRLWIWFFAGFMCLGASTALEVRGKDPSPCHPEVWQGAIDKFEKADATKAPPANAVLFVGSSSIVMWDTAKWFPDMATINRGFGGSQICDATYFTDALVIKYKPRVIVFYSGDNDIAGGKTAEQVHADFCDFMKTIRRSLPLTPVVFITIKPSIARWKLRDAMLEANRLIAGEIRIDKYLTILDVWPSMLGDDGQPNKELFLEDGLHMNEAGYKIWSDLVRRQLATLEMRKKEKS